MAAYIVSIIRVLDAEAFARFRATSTAGSSVYGGEELLRGAVTALLEGDVDIRGETVAVVRFPSADHARALIESAGARLNRQRRQGIVDVTMRLVVDKDS